MTRFQRTLTFLFLLFMPFVAHAQQQLFSLYEEMDGVTTINISKHMLRSMGGLAMGKKKLGNVAQQLSSLQILTCENPKLAATIRTTAEGYYKKKRYTQVLRNHEKGSFTIIYQRQLPNKEYEYALLSSTARSIQLINIVGRITLQQLQDYY